MYAVADVDCDQQPQTAIIVESFLLPTFPAAVVPLQTATHEVPEHAVPAAVHCASSFAHALVQSIEAALLLV